MAESISHSHLRGRPVVRQPLNILYWSVSPTALPVGPGRGFEFSAAGMPSLNKWSKIDQSDLQTSLTRRQDHLQVMSTTGPRTHPQIIGSLPICRPQGKTSPETRKVCIRTLSHRIHLPRPPAPHSSTRTPGERTSRTSRPNTPSGRGGLLETRIWSTGHCPERTFDWASRRPSPLDFSSFELLTTAQHAIRPDHRLSIAIAWKEASRVLELLYSDNGQACPRPPTSPKPIRWACASPHCRPTTEGRAHAGRHPVNWTFRPTYRDQPDPMASLKEPRQPRPQAD